MTSTTNAYTPAEAQAQYKAVTTFYEVTAAQTLGGVFSPPHHGPRNIPITVSALASGDTFTHFPIVESGTYALFIKSPAANVTATFLTGGAYSVEIATTPLTGSDLNGSGSDGYFTYGIKTTQPIDFNGGDPNPVAIQFTGPTSAEIKYIVTKLNG